MIGQKIFLIKKWSLWLVRQRKETLFLSVALDLNSQPSSHNYYHHQDLTLSTLVLFYPYVYTRCLQCLDRFR